MIHSFETEIEWPTGWQWQQIFFCVWVSCGANQHAVDCECVNCPEGTSTETTYNTESQPSECEITDISNIYNTNDETSNGNDSTNSDDTSNSSDLINPSGIEKI